MRLIMDLQKLIIQQILVQWATFFAQLRTPSNCGFQCNGKYLRSMKNVVILRVSVQRATPLPNEERRHIAGSSARGPFIMQKCVCNTYRVESSMTFSLHGKQYVTNTDSVRHNKHFHFWRCGTPSLYIQIYSYVS